MAPRACTIGDGHPSRRPSPKPGVLARRHRLHRVSTVVAASNHIRWLRNPLTVGSVQKLLGTLGDVEPLCPDVFPRANTVLPAEGTVDVSGHTAPRGVAGAGVGAAYPTLYLRATTPDDSVDANALASAVITTESFGGLVGSAAGGGVASAPAILGTSTQTGLGLVYLGLAAALVLAAVADPLRGLELIAAAPPDRPDPGSHDRSGRRSRCDTVAAYASRIAVVPNLVASGSTRETSTSDSQPESSAVDPLEGPLRSSAGGRTRDRPSQKATTASQSRRKAVRHC